MVEWVGPVYKKLAKSELGSEHGHTSGIVPTTDTRSFFGEPLLYKKSHFIKKMVIDFSYGREHIILKANVMYFFSKTHKHVHITGGGLMPAYKRYGAKEGDVLLFWKSMYDPSAYRAQLVKQNSKKWDKIKNFVDKKGGFIKSKIEVDDESLENNQEEDYQQESLIDPAFNDSDFPPTKKPSSIKISESNRFPRNKAKGDYVLKKSEYKCSVDSSHKTFVSRTGNIYMEKHHLIPLEYFNEFENSLDDINNISCICPLCHRKLHNGKTTEVLPILKKLWERKKSGLKESNISVDFDRLAKMYFS